MTQAPFKCTSMLGHRLRLRVDKNKNKDSYTHTHIMSLHSDEGFFSHMVFLHHVTNSKRVWPRKEYAMAMAKKQTIGKE
jgi:hypothetical protein